MHRRNGTSVVRWHGFIKSLHAGAYHFGVRVDGSWHNYSSASSSSSSSSSSSQPNSAPAWPAGFGVRIWVDGRLMRDDWNQVKCVAMY